MKQTSLTFAARKIEQTVRMKIALHRVRRAIVLTILSSYSILIADAQPIKGTVNDSSNEPIIGATIKVKQKPSIAAVTGLDGSFTIDCDIKNPIFICSYIGCKTVEQEVTSDDVVITLPEEAVVLGEVTITAMNTGNGEIGARTLERTAPNVINIMSAAAIDLSPDVTVANVIQRMSGVTVERNGTGEGQYAILRGMDKRFNYTLVNGVKIPSPDNKNRFVPLDMFPSEMLDRLEVIKSPTANLEGDGIGGAVNLVMKDAPYNRQLNINFSTGYNALFFNRDFQSFNYGAIVSKSPFERNISTDYSVTSADFSSDNFRTKSRRPLPDFNLGICYGDRFFDNRFGVMLSGTWQNVARGKDSDLYYKVSGNNYGIEHRLFSEQVHRLGLHSKLDYHFNMDNNLQLYLGYMDMITSQVRDARDDKTWTMRMRYNRQRIMTANLNGEHKLLDGALKINWRGVASKATSTTPDNALFTMQGTHVSTSGAATRRWEHNSDRDFAGYADLQYSLNSNWLIIAGGMYRDKQRTSFFNEYTFDSATGPEHVQVYGVDWTDFDQIAMVPREYGNIGDPLNYDATERIGAAYLMAKYNNRYWEANAGVRLEHSDQGYVLKYPRDVDPEGRQKYYDFLPSFNVQYALQERMSLRLSYYAAINRPSFFEIVPYSIINEEYKEKGNPDLKHTKSHNVDLRYEYFPRASEQIMIGLFYKNIIDPIEYGLLNEGQDTYYMPMNFGDANNYGVEIDITKYFNWIGFKANYTYTHSAITTTKRNMEGSEIVTVEQTRPLYGQAAHVANLSIILKDTHYGWSGQIAGGYTGKRLANISNWLDNDVWEAGSFRLDLSVEKKFNCGLCAFAKIGNLLNTPTIRYIHKGPHTDGVTDAERYHGNILERKERHGQSFTIGLKYTL